MKKKFVLSAMLVLILVLTGCSDPADSGGGAQPGGNGNGNGQDTALNGKWVRSGTYSDGGRWEEIWKLDKGDYEVWTGHDDHPGPKSSVKYKGTYTADGSNITMTLTHMWFGKEYPLFEGELKPEKWYTKAELKALGMFNDQDIDKTFAPQKGTYTISNNGSSLTINLPDRSDSYTKQ